METIKTTTPKGVFIPLADLEPCKLQEGDSVEVSTRDNLMVILKRGLTAPELLDVVQEFSWLAAGLLYDLSKTCGPCTDCECGETSACPYNNYGGEPVQTNDFLLQDAGIPEGAKLCAEVDKEKHRITVSEAEHRYDLSDLSPDLLETFAATGTCLRALEEHLIREDIVYGEARK